MTFSPNISLFSVKVKPSIAAVIASKVVASQ